ncbi:MAG: LamG domain-containing protein [bacterium]|nr:LamG domain-containing protein [bacterium]
MSLINLSEHLIAHYKLDNSSPDGIEKDVSGNGHDGIKNGSLTYSSDSARYIASTQFNYSTISNIQIPYLFADNQQINEFSLSCWINSEKSTEYHNFITLNGNRFIRCRITPGRNLQMILYINNSTKVVSADLGGMLSENTWNLINVIFRNGVFNVYLNSVFMAKSDYSAESSYMLYTHTHNNYIGSFDGTSENFNGSISDVRIYSTALSDDEIKELYETSAIIDDRGNLYAYDFVEDDDVKIGKNGVINASTFEENGNGDCKVYADGKISANKFIAY